MEKTGKEESIIAMIIITVTSTAHNRTDKTGNMMFMIIIRNIKYHKEEMIASNRIKGGIPPLKQTKPPMPIAESFLGDDRAVECRLRPYTVMMGQSTKQIFSPSLHSHVESVRKAKTASALAQS